MKNKYIFVTTLLISLVALGLCMITFFAPKQKSEKADFTVVTSFYPIYILTLNIIGPDTEGVELLNLSEPQTGCLHDFQLTPEDMKLLSGADVFVVNGEMENFLVEVSQAYPEVTLVEACENLTLLEEEAEEEACEEEGHHHDHQHDHGHGNSHAWMSVTYYRQMVDQVLEGLIQADPERKDLYERNATAYQAKLQTLQEQQEELKHYLAGQKVISFHESFEYIAYDYDMEIVTTIDFDEERPISPGEVAEVLHSISHDGASLILAEELYGKTMVDTIQSEDDIEIMAIYLDPLNKGDYRSDAYLLGMEQNIRQIKELLVE